MNARLLHGFILEKKVLVGRSMGGRAAFTVIRAEAPVVPVIVLEQLRNLLVLGATLDTFRVPILLPGSEAPAACPFQRFRSQNATPGPGV